MSGYESVAQDFCCLPWCGKTTGMNDEHHLDGNHDNNAVENRIGVCHEHHMKHHGEGGRALHYRPTTRDESGRRVTFLFDDEGHSGFAVFPDPNRDTPSPEALTDEQGEALSALEECALIYSEDANAASWKLSHVVRGAFDVLREAYPDREARRRLTEWGENICDEDGNHRPIAPSTLRKLLTTASMPALPEVIALSLTERDRLRRALASGRVDFDAALSDLMYLSREDFDFRYLGKKPWLERVPFDPKEDE